ncbi:hypothetical protein MO767_11205, partial [Pseudomonas sp. UYIF39]|uniref:hypothetical protein n=1 Tax=Pseudomonas sp. UYIF39 TaxID=1630747 RepID=UPI00249DB9C5
MLFLFEMPAVLSSGQRSTNDKFNTEMFDKCMLLTVRKAPLQKRHAWINGCGCLPRVFATAVHAFCSSCRRLRSAAKQSQKGATALFLLHRIG